MTKTLKQLLSFYGIDNSICYRYDMIITEVVKEWLTQKRQIRVSQQPFEDLRSNYMIGQLRLIDELLEELK